MMTFIVIGDFILNAQLLDNARLAKQRVEACQIIDAIIKGTGWKNHPITKAWANYLDALKYYTNCIIIEFIRRGGKNNIPLYDIPDTITVPWWFTWDKLHQSHRAMLYRKDPFYYYDKFTIDSEYLSYGYIWPTDELYFNQNLTLDKITSPIPKHLINPKYCPNILKSGKRKGQTCNRLIKNTYKNHCNIHKS